MDKDSVLIGFPFSGALFWLFDDIVSKRNDIHQNYYGTHPYYKTIYGKIAGEYINLATSISLLFPQIYLIPVDTKYPESEKYFNEYRYYNKEFGIITDFSWVLDAQNIFEIIPLLKEDKVVKKYKSLKIVPQEDEL